jgi:hypothetical protein
MLVSGEGQRDRPSRWLVQMQSPPLIGCVNLDKLSFLCLSFLMSCPPHRMDEGETCRQPLPGRHGCGQESGRGMRQWGGGLPGHHLSLRRRLGPRTCLGS